MSMSALPVARSGSQIHSRQQHPDHQHRINLRISLMVSGDFGAS
jgi:hypothetical protein